jgi:hypothetical protein
VEFPFRRDSGRAAIAGPAYVRTGASRDPARLPDDVRVERIDEDVRKSAEPPINLGPARPPLVERDDAGAGAGRSGARRRQLDSQSLDRSERTAAGLPTTPPVRSRRVERDEAVGIVEVGGAPEPVVQ